MTGHLTLGVTTLPLLSDGRSTDRGVLRLLRLVEAKLQRGTDGATRECAYE